MKRKFQRDAKRGSRVGKMHRITFLLSSREYKIVKQFAEIEEMSSVQQSGLEMFREAIRVYAEAINQRQHVTDIVCSFS
jgi:hypothetical protein